MCAKWEFGIALCGLLWCCLAGLPQAQVTEEGTYRSCCAMVICDGRLVIAFSNWGAGPRGGVDDLVIATANTPEPAAQSEWRFHLVKQGLRISPTDFGLDKPLALFPAGKGIALVSIQSFKSGGTQRQLFAAWCAGLPQRSADWVVSPIGIRVQQGTGHVAGAGTADYVAAAVLPDQASLGVGPPRIPGVYLALAKLPLAGRYDEWQTVCVQLDAFPQYTSDHHSRLVLGSATGLSIATCGDSLFLACYADLLRYNVLGIETRQPMLVVGECRNPVDDPSHWEFVAIDRVPISLGSSLFATDGTCLYLVYDRLMYDGYEDACMAECASSRALEPRAWRVSRVAASGSMWDLGVVGGLPTAAGCITNTLRSLVYYNYVMPDFVEPRWTSCPVPGLAGNPSIADAAGRPALCCYSFDGGLQYAWAGTRFPVSESDWHSVTVFAGEPSFSQMAAPPTQGTSVFPPIPVPGPTEKLAAGAVRVPPPFRLTWPLGLLAGLVLAAAAWTSLRCSKSWAKRHGLSR
jgi:hypothetical protein